MKPAAFVGLIAAALVLHPAGPLAQTAKFRYLTSIYADGQGAALSLPEGVACGPSGEIVVGDTGNNRLVRFTYQDKTVAGGSVMQAPQAAAPSRVRLTAKGDLLVLNARERRVVRLTAAGEFKAAVAFSGAPTSATIVAKSFTTDAADRVYVSDVFSSRVLVADADGAFQRILPFPERLGFGSDLAVDEAGTLFLLDSAKRRIYSAARDATTFTALGGDLSEAIATLPTFLLVSKGSMFVLEGPAGRIVSLRRDGTFIARQLTSGREEGALAQPSQMCINDRDEVFIADRDNSRIQVFQLIR